MTPEPCDPLALAAALVAIPSCDPPGGELAVAERVHAELARLGIAAEIDRFAPGRANVTARVPGRGTSPPLVFSAHMDTVPEGDQPWSFPAFSGAVRDGLLHGRGASDMKGALAAFVAAADRIARRAEPLAGDVILAFTAGESARCIGARRLVERGFRSEIGAFLCGEPSSFDLIVAEKAVIWIEAVATGRQGHVSGDPGTNAIRLMGRFLDALDGLEIAAPAHPLLSPPSLSVGRIEGGSAVNVTPARCRAEIDVRVPSGVAPEAVLERLRAAAPEGVALAVMDVKPAVETDPASPFVRLCGAATQAGTGRAPAVRGVSYYSDAAVLLDGLDVPFAILGPGRLGASGEADETAPAEAIRTAARLYADIAASWLP